MFWERTKNRLIARAANLIPGLSDRLAQNYEPRSLSDQAVPWVPVTRALAEARVGLVTTSGIHHSSQTPFDMTDPDGDPSYRELSGETLFEDFTITHDYYDHRDAEKDPNIILPLDRLRDWIDAGLVGSLSRRHFGFMGHVDGRHIPTLIRQGAKVGRLLQNDQVDLVLLTPS